MEVIKRVRDKLQKRSKEVISLQDWEQIEARYTYAITFLKDDNPIHQMLKASLEDGREIILHNRVREVKEVKIIGDIQKIFTTPKDEQINELVGQIKFIEILLGELQSWVASKQQLEQMEAANRVVIERNGEVVSE